jgi:hypothetical protein
MTDEKTQRDTLLARYSVLRSAIETHLNAALKFASALTLKDAARRLGLLADGDIVADCFSEVSLVYDLSVFGHKPGQSRAIDRYAQAAHFPPGSPQAITLTALHADIFRVVRIKGRHPIAGNIIEDMAHKEDLWLLDEGLEQTMKEGVTLALRLIPIEDFYTTVGAIVPRADTVLPEALSSLAARPGKRGFLGLDDPRLPQAIYTAAISHGIMQSMNFPD